MAPASGRGSSSPISSTDRESRSRDRESDSEPCPGGDRDTRSLVKVVSGDGFPESMDKLSLEVAGGREITVDRAAEAGAWLIECLWGRARDRGGVTGGQETEL